MATPISVLSKSLQAVITAFEKAVVLSYPKAMFTASVVAGFTATTAVVAFSFSKAGPFNAIKSITFTVPGPEVGVGLPFLFAAAAFGLYKLYQARRSLSV